MCTAGTGFFAAERLWCALKCEFSTETYQSRNQFVFCPPEMEHISKTLWFCSVEWNGGQSGDKDSSTVSRVLFLLSYRHNCRSCISGLYWIPQSVSAVHISHHQVGRWLTEKVKWRGLSLQRAVYRYCNLIIILLVKRDNKRK